MRLPALLLLALAWTLLPTRVHAQAVQRCVGADGRAVYTDQRCDDVGAADRLPAQASDGARMFRDGCPRTLSQLVGEIGAAVTARDVNRLASLYDWAGVSDATANSVLDRLEGVVSRPLVDIAPVYPYAPADGAGDAAAYAAPASTASARPAAASGPERWMPSWDTAPASADTGTDAGIDIDPGAGAGPGMTQDAAPAPPPARIHPVALRIEQTLGHSATPSRTVFGLRRAFGCFWISL